MLVTVLRDADRSAPVQMLAIVVAVPLATAALPRLRPLIHMLVVRHKLQLEQGVCIASDQGAQ